MIALTILSVARVELTATQAEYDRARANAACDAGIAIAIKGLLANEAAGRWTIDGRTVHKQFGDAALALRVEDERGKVPISRLDDGQLTALLEFGGLAGERLLIAHDSLNDWIDDNDEPLPNGAENDYYQRYNVVPRNGPLRTIEELGRIRGFDPALIARIRPLLTVDFGDAPFDPRFAQPKALGIMYGTGADSPQAIQRAREAAGQVTALGFTSGVELVGRPLSVVADATLPDGARAQRRVVIEITGSKLRPYVVKRYE